MFGMNNLTQKQSEILRFLRKYKREKGTAPTYREIAGWFGFKSVRSASDHVSALEKKGYLRRHSGRSRGIELLCSERSPTKGSVSVPLLRNLPAGSSEEKTEYDHDIINVDHKLLKGFSDNRLLALKIDGDSMDKSGIHEGDWIVADADAAAQEGDVVVALINGRNTLKILARKKGGFYLKSENSDRSDWIPLEALAIQGVVKTVLRRMT